MRTLLLLAAAALVAGVPVPESDNTLVDSAANSALYESGDNVATDAESEIAALDPNSEYELDFLDAEDEAALDFLLGSEGLSSSDADVSKRGLGVSGFRTSSSGSFGSVVVHKGGGGGGHSGGGGGGHSGGSSGGSRGGGSSSGSSSGSHGGGSSSGGKGGGSSGGSSGRKGGGSRGGSSGGKGGSDGGKGGGNSNGRTPNDPPPPYSPRDSNGPPPPYSPGTYGNRGSYRNGWNGQYYPYSSYGYGSAVPMGVAAAPFFLAGPYGFYGPYGGGSHHSRANATVDNMYVNGSQLGNGTWVNGTLLNETYDDGKYTVYQTKGSYEGGQEIDDGVVVNGTFVNPLSAPVRTDINPNKSSNGTTLHSSGAKSSAGFTWAPAVVAAVAFII